MFKLNPFKRQPAATSSPDSGKSDQDKTPHYPFTEEGIRARAQQVYERRKASGLVGTPKGDWQQAIKELKWERSPFGKFYRWTGLGQKNGWDLAQLLAVPIMLALVSWSLSEYAKSRDQQQQKADKEKAQALADDKAKQDTLVKYLDDMSKSIEGGLLKAKPGDDKFIVAQSRTVLALQSLNKERRRLVIQFLKASGLNQVSDNDDTKKFMEELVLGNHLKLLSNHPKLSNPSGNVKLGLLYRVQMEKANLVNSDFSGATLIWANLKAANLGCNPFGSKGYEHCSDLTGADLRGADLGGVFLSGAYLSSADLEGADLRGADLSTADLIGVNFSHANLSHTNFRNANLSGVNLYEAYFWYANIEDAILLRTDLGDVQGLTPQQLVGKDAPLLCNVRFPKNITGIDPNRDCDRLPQKLVDRKLFPDLQSAQKIVDMFRQEEFKYPPSPH